jgi:cell division transport system permease protein
MNLKAWATRHAQNFVGALGELTRNPVGTALTVTVMGIALALPASLYVLVQNGRELAGSWQDIRDFSVYLKPGTALAQAQKLERQLEGESGVSRVELITADDAAAELRRDPAFNAGLGALESNPLPHTLVVRPADSASPEDVAALARRTGANPAVDLVKLDTDWLARLNAIFDVVRRGVLIAAGLLMAAVLVIVGNTIRLDIQNRAAEIEVAKLLGATDGFVRRPFLYLGLWYGVLGGLIALLLLFGILWALADPVASLAGLYDSGFAVAGPPARTALSVLAGGILAGWGGAWLAVGRHLAAIQPRA